MGVEARCRPSKSAAHHRHMKRQPFLCNCCPRHGRRHCHRRCHLSRQLRRRCRRRCHCNRPSLLPLPLAIAVAVAISHCCHHLCRVAVSHRCCRRPCRWPLPSPSPSAIAVAIAIGHHHRHALAIAKIFCLGAGRIVFKQSKQRMLTLFYFVRTVGSVLIKAGSLTRCRAAMANTSIGQQAASSEQPVREVAGGRGAAGGQQGGDID